MALAHPWKVPGPAEHGAEAFPFSADTADALFHAPQLLNVGELRFSDVWSSTYEIALVQLKRETTLMVPLTWLEGCG